MKMAFVLFLSRTDDLISQLGVLLKNQARTLHWYMKTKNWMGVELEMLDINKNPTPEVLKKIYVRQNESVGERNF